MQQYVHDKARRDVLVRRVILAEGFANVVVLVAKLAVGLSTGSLAVLGDALHSVTDVANNGVAWVVMRLSEQPADREHPYGHRKFETLAVFALATLMSVIAFELAVRAIRRPPTAVVQDPRLLALMCGVLVVNIIVATWERRWAQRLQADILLADASHTFADVLVVIVVIVGWQLSARGFLWLDSLCALGVAGLILYLAYGLFRRVLPVLVDERAIRVEPLAAAIRDVAGVRAVQRVRSRWIGSRSAVDVVVSVNAELSTAEAHRIADAIESRLETQFGVDDISVHIEPDSSAPERRGL